ncbi:pyridoxamine 5'-phosphate oxidase family protein [Maribacter sp. MMG018]|uniref:pyridoxamine 5'-phosphate oxidase family protein n=1 Tax=Maribacter sp. MMG018 TaxID=2822688 RepID=UPI001B390162|nr:pyridoxamine 5'-phosphate oxidase family protein [Maribacter sp. MMG018]MBQ4914461.1 pyridoxamine 5'-phosphate oxidase family protein [Maribacter sp. MMG018]
MTDTYWNELKDELQKGVNQKDHPFRYATLGTVGMDKLARLRTVVLREVLKNGNLRFYTDRRSKKVLHMIENPKVSMLFYQPQKLLQIKVEGLATVHTDQDTISDIWKNIPENNKKDYTTNYAPGSGINDPDTISYLEGDHFFCMVEVEPFKIEYLKLNRPNHIRVKYSKNDYGWESEFLVP